MFDNEHGFFGGLCICPSLNQWSHIYLYNSWIADGNSTFDCFWHSSFEVFTGFRFCFVDLNYAFTPKHILSSMALKIQLIQANQWNTHAHMLPHAPPPTHTHTHTHFHFDFHFHFSTTEQTVNITWLTFPPSSNRRLSQPHGTSVAPGHPSCSCGWAPWCGRGRATWWAWWWAGTLSAGPPRSGSTRSTPARRWGPPPPPAAWRP